jgi:hypothetical protein
MNDISDCRTASATPGILKRAYCVVLAYFRCPVVTLITFSSNPIVTLKAIQKKIQENSTFFRKSKLTKSAQTEILMSNFGRIIYI